MQQSVEREYRFGLFRFVTPDRALFRESTSVDLTPKTADLLLVLLEDAGKLISKDDLIARAWAGTAVSDSNLTFHIYLLRQALGETGDRPEFVATVPKRGYRFIAPVTERSPTPSIEEPSPVAPVDTAPLVPEPEPVPVVPDASTPHRLRVRWLWLTLFAGAPVALIVGALIANLAEPSPPRIGKVTPLTRDSSIKQPPLLSDGLRLYLTTMIQERAAWMPLDGGEATLLSALKDLRPTDVSAVRSEFLAVSRVPGGSPQEVWAVPTRGLTPRRVGSLRCDYAAWSPKGDSIVCANGNTVIVSDAEGHTQRQIASLPATVEAPRWSPDGERLRFDVSFVVRGFPVPSIWEVRKDGTDLHEVVSDANRGGACCGNWTPDGRLFVFQSPRNGKSHLWALQERRALLHRRPRGEPVRLTAGDLSFSRPFPSADGKVIYAFGEPEHVGELVRYDTASQRFVPYLGGISATWVTFSPDRELVAYISFPDNILWCARADGSEKRQLTVPSLDVAGLAWAPDSKRIAFRAGMPGKRKKIYLIDVQGGTPEPIVPDDVEQGIPGWSPDGRRLVFGDVPEAFGNPTGVETLHVFDLERKAISSVPGSGGLWTSRWSPDGRYISALTISIREQQTLRLFDCKTERWRTLGANHVNNPTWSPDSRYIYYDTESNIRSLRRVRVSDGYVEQITDLETYPVAHYGWSGLALDGSPIILGQRYDVQVYALELIRP